MNVVLVVPCFNEGKRINSQTFVSRKDICFLFVNDGSSDNTSEVLEGMKSDTIKVLELTINMGKAEAVRLGMLESLKVFPECEWIGYWDSDLATPLDQVEFMMNYLKIQHTKFSAIFGSRLMRLGARIRRNLLRHVLARFFVTFASFALGTTVYDSQCGAKIFERKIVKEIFSESFISKWFFDLEIILKMSALGLTAVECPIERWVDVEGSKVKPIRDGIRGLWEILKIRNKYGKFKNF